MSKVKIAVCALESCNESFAQRNSRHRYCCANCRQEANNEKARQDRLFKLSRSERVRQLAFDGGQKRVCQCCGKAHNGKGKYCSTRCRVAAHRARKRAAAMVAANQVQGVAI